MNRQRRLRSKVILRMLDIVILTKSITRFEIACLKHMRLTFKVKFLVFHKEIFTLSLIASVLTAMTNKSITCWSKCKIKSWSSHHSLTLRYKESCIDISKSEYLLYVTIRIRLDHSDERYYCNMNCVSSNCASSNLIFDSEVFFKRIRLEHTVLQIIWSLKRFDIV